MSENIVDMKNAYTELFIKQLYEAGQDLYQKVKPVFESDFRLTGDVETLYNLGMEEKVADAWDDYPRGRYEEDYPLRKKVKIKNVNALYVGPFEPSGYAHVEIRPDDYVDEGFNIFIEVFGLVGGEYMLTTDPIITGLKKDEFYADVRESFTPGLKKAAAQSKEKIKTDRFALLSDGDPIPVESVKKAELTKNVTSSLFLHEIEDDESVYDTDKTLFDYLEESGFEYLLPKTDNDKYTVDPSDVILRRLYDDGYEPEEEEAEDDYDDTEEDYYDDELGGFKPERDTEEEFNEKIFELKEMFCCSDISDYEFIHSNPWSFLGLSAKQFHKLNPLDYDYTNFGVFAERMTDDIVNSVIPDVNQRIRYATLYANSNLTWELANDDDVQYLLRLSSGRSLNEAISLVQTYMDYLAFRSHAIQYNDEIIAEAENPEHPYFEYPRFPKPSAIRDLHDKAMRDSNSFSDLKYAQETEILNEQIKEFIQTPEYKRLLYRGAKFSVIAATCVEDLKQEGKTLKHCIGNYGHKFASRQSMIYFARENSDLAQPYYSIEVVDHIKHCDLTQLYTYNDSTEKTPEFEAFIREWCEVKNLKIKCVW